MADSDITIEVLKGIRGEMREFRGEMGEFRNEMYEFRDETRRALVANWTACL